MVDLKLENLKVQVPADLASHNALPTPTPMNDEALTQRCIDLVRRMDAVAGLELHTLLVREIEPLEPSRNALVQSEIGLRMRKLSKAADAQVSTAASRILAAWKATWKAQTLGTPSGVGVATGVAHVLGGLYRAT